MTKIIPTMSMNEINSRLDLDPNEKRPSIIVCRKSEGNDCQFNFFTPLFNNRKAALSFGKQSVVLHVESYSGRNVRFSSEGQGNFVYGIGKFKAVFPDGKKLIIDEAEIWNWARLLEEDSLIFTLSEDIALVVWREKENRHGKVGHRGLIYVDGNWDESYLFFTSLVDVVISINNDDFKIAKSRF